MKKTNNQPGGKRPILVSLLAVILLLVSGYFGIPLIEEPDSNEYSQNQEIRKGSGKEDPGQSLENQDSKEKFSGQNQGKSTGSQGREQEDTSLYVIKYKFRSDKLWQEHYEKHGIEMGFDSPQDYLMAANKVIENKEALHKLEAEDGDDVYYLEETNEFAIVSTDGYLRTYFYPAGGIEYFNRQ